MICAQDINSHVTYPERSSTRRPAVACCFYQVWWVRKKEKLPLVLGIHILYLVDELRLQIMYFYQTTIGGSTITCCSQHLKVCTIKSDRILKLLHTYLELHPLQSRNSMPEWMIQQLSCDRLARNLSIRKPQSCKKSPNHENHHSFGNFTNVITGFLTKRSLKGNEVVIHVT